MIKYSILKNGIITNSWTNDYAGSDYYEPCFGRPERWVKENQEDISQAIETREVEEQIGLDQDGQPVMGTVIEYKLAADYTVETVDVTNQLQAQKDSDEARAYLLSTDWYIIRQMDTSEACPQEIKDLRAVARLKVIN